MSQRGPNSCESPTSEFTKRSRSLSPKLGSPALSDQSEGFRKRLENAVEDEAKGGKLLQTNEDNAKKYGKSGNWPADPSLKHFSKNHKPSTTEAREIKVTKKLPKTLKTFCIAEGATLSTENFRVESKKKDPNGSTEAVMDADFDPK